MKSKKSAVRFSGASTDLLHNKYILYLSFFFAVLTAARYLFNFNLEAIIIFVVLGFLTTYFSKNMIVILLTTTIGTNFIMMFKNKSAPVYYNIMEGMENKNGNGAAPTADATNGAPPTTGGASAPVTSAPNAGADAAANQDLTKHMNNMVSAINAAKNGVSGAPPVTTPTLSNNVGSMPDTATPAVDAFTKKKSEAMTQLNPASYGGSSGDNALSSMFSGMAAGATGQKNQAYDAMNSLGGSANTGNLLGQQTEMINNLKSIEPILNTAEKFLDKFENSSISKMFQNMGSIPGMSLLTGGGGNGGGNGLNPASVGS
jgi:hypothetical protein